MFVCMQLLVNYKLMDTHSKLLQLQQTSVSQFDIWQSAVSLLLLMQQLHKLLNLFQIECIRDGDTSPTSQKQLKRWFISQKRMTSLLVRSFLSEFLLHLEWMKSITKKYAY